MLLATDKARWEGKQEMKKKKQWTKWSHSKENRSFPVMKICLFLSRILHIKAWQYCTHNLFFLPLLAITEISGGAPAVLTGKRIKAVSCVFKNNQIDWLRVDGLQRMHEENRAELNTFFDFTLWSGSEPQANDMTKCSLIFHVLKPAFTMWSGLLVTRKGK